MLCEYNSPLKHWKLLVKLDGWLFSTRAPWGLITCWGKRSKIWVLAPFETEKERKLHGILRSQINRSLIYMINILRWSSMIVLLQHLYCGMFHTTPATNTMHITYGSPSSKFLAPFGCRHRTVFFWSPHPTCLRTWSDRIERPGATARTIWP